MEKKPQCLQNALRRGRRSKRSLRKNSQRKEEVSHYLSEPGSPHVLQGFFLLRGSGCSLVIPYLSVSFTFLTHSTHPSFPLSSKQAPVAPIKTNILTPQSPSTDTLPFYTPSEPGFPKPWSLWLSPLPHFSLSAHCKQNIHCKCSGKVTSASTLLNPTCTSQSSLASSL